MYVLRSEQIMGNSLECFHQIDVVFASWVNVPVGIGEALRVIFYWLNVYCKSGSVSIFVYVLFGLQL